jgi:GMC oxidoreductase
LVTCSARKSFARRVTAEFAERVRNNQARLTSALKSQYDFIVCGSGSSGSVVARRLAENPDISVLLLEAGGDDDVPSGSPNKSSTSRVVVVSFKAQASLAAC